MNQQASTSSGGNKKVNHRPPIVLDESDEKKRIRQLILRKRDAMPQKKREDKSRRITETILALPAYQQADDVLCFRSFGSEYQTNDLIQTALEDGKSVYLPRVEGRRVMSFYKYEDGDTLETNRYGIEEPVPDTARLWTPNMKDSSGSIRRALVIVPCVAFDPRLNRIGYGAGYYDGFVSQSRRKMRGAEAPASDDSLIFFAGAAFALQMIKEPLPMEAQDQKTDLFVTEYGTILGE